MTKKTNARKTKAKPTAIPMSISIHGDGIDIDASFSNSQLSKTLTEILSRASTKLQPPAAPQPVAQPDPWVELITELMSSLSKEQLETIEPVLTSSQKMLVMELATLSKVPPKKDEPAPSNEAMPAD